MLNIGGKRFFSCQQHQKKKLCSSKKMEEPILGARPAFGPARPGTQTNGKQKINLGEKSRHGSLRGVVWREKVRMGLIKGLDNRDWLKTP